MGKKNSLVWYEVPSPMPGADCYFSTTGLRVTESTDLIEGREFQHVVVSRADRYPSWEDILMVKEHFIGDEVEAYQVLPRKSEYVNLHPNCFHLWRALGGDLMPS